MADKIPPVRFISPHEPARAITGIGETDPSLYQTYAASLVAAFNETLIQDEKRRKKFSVCSKKALRKKKNGVEKIEAIVKSRLR